MTPFGLTISHARVEQTGAELRADQHERIGDVGRAEVDVIGAWRTVLTDGLLEAVLLVRGALGQREVAVGHVASGAVDLRQQVALAQRAVGCNHPGPVHRITDPQVAGVLVQERAALDAAAAQRPGRGTLGRQ